MKPAPFVHHRAQSLDHALELLAGDGGDAKVLAGGQSLVPLLAMRLAQPTALVDLGGLSELASIRDEGEVIEIGAMARTRDVETSPLVAEALPLLPAALRYSGHVTIRNRGTFGGSAAHADPAGEIPSALRALDAQLVVAGPRGERTVAAADFFHGFLVSALDPDEILTAVRIPRQPAGTVVAVQEFARRHGDFALLAVLGTLRLDDGGVIVDARLALAGAAAVPVRASRAEQTLIGQFPSAELVRAAADAAAASTDPPDDVHASADYRRTLARVLTRRCLEQALPRLDRSVAA